MGYRLVTQSLLVTCRPFVKGWIYVRASLWFRIINVNGCPLVWRLNMRYRQGVTMYVPFLLLYGTTRRSSKQAVDKMAL